MTEPICTIPWSYEHKRQIRVYTDAELDSAEQQDLCLAIARDVLGADSQQVLTASLRKLADARGFDLTIYGFDEPPDHYDPLGNLVSVALRRHVVD